MSVVVKKPAVLPPPAGIPGPLNGHVEEMYGGHVVVTAFNGQEKALRILMG